MTDLAAPPPGGVEVRPLMRTEYEALVDTGVLEGEPVELLGGRLVRLSPQGTRHSFAVMVLTRQLAPLLAQGLHLGVQVPLATDDESLLEPDISILRSSSPDAHQTTALAVIEVSVSSQTYDLQHKAPRYAAAGVPLYIVLDLPKQRAVVHREPDADGYRIITTLGPGDDLEVEGQPLDLAELLDP